MRYIKFDEYYKKNKIEFMKKRLLIRDKRLRKSRKRAKKSGIFYTKFQMKNLKNL